MNIGIGLPNVVPGTEGRELVHWARRAEELGFDSLAVIDRVVYDSYEPLLALAMAAAVTERIELVTNVLIAPVRGTAMLAKQAASLDRASAGRLTLGLALGARDDDFAVCGLSPRQRGRMLEAQLAELRRIWSEAGSPGGIGPAPSRPAGPRLLIGGDVRYAGARAARYGDGWTMMVGSPAEFAAGVEAARAAWQEAGRPGAPRTMAVFYAAVGGDAAALAERAVGGYYAWLGQEIAGYIVASAALGEEAIAERVDAFAAAGADDVIVVPCSADPGQLEGIAAAALRTPALV
jgi:alkanesulfonate monooxygenase SsuD/methylene tetrahydromethanopterin reductase-like flavin-dependent oxidoreductase (luciferase family)